MIASKNRNVFGLLFLLNILIYFIFVFPYIPQYISVRDTIYGNKDIQFIALFATLFGFSVAIEYLDRISRRLKDTMKENEKRDREKKPLQLKEIELKKSLVDKEREFFEKSATGEDVSIVNKEIDDIKKNIIDIQEKIQFL